MVLLHVNNHHVNKINIYRDIFGVYLSQFMYKLVSLKSVS